MTATVTAPIASDRNYVHTQGVPATLWTVVHSLGKKPAVTALDSSGRQVFGDVTHIDDNRLTIAFGAAFSGSATCN